MNTHVTPVSGTQLFKRIHSLRLISTMLREALLAVSITLFISFQAIAGDALFPIYEGDKVGYMDSTGAVVIQPVFRSAGEFSEGLAPARKSGTYGYIDATGSFVIPPRFDYAYPFRGGVAVVYIHGKACCINRSGSLLVDPVYKAISWFENGRATVLTYSMRYGIINSTGKLVIDTAYSKIQPFESGYVVEGPNHRPFPRDNKEPAYETGVLDSLGRPIVEYGLYSNIGPCSEGYCMVQFLPEKRPGKERVESKAGFINTEGKLMIVEDLDKDMRLSGSFHQGLAKVELKNHEGFIDKQGNVVIGDYRFYYAYGFSDNRCFVQTADRRYFVIDKQGKLISQKMYDEHREPGFVDGRAFVEVDNQWGIIDTNCQFIVEPQYRNIGPGFVGNCFFYEYTMEEDDEIDEYDLLEDSTLLARLFADDEEVYGVAGLDGLPLFETKINQYSPEGFVHGVLTCYIGQQLTYLDTKGNILWQEQEKQLPLLSNLNIDFMNRGYFYAASKPHESDLGGWGAHGNVSHNAARKKADNVHFPDKQVSVTVLPQMQDTIYSRYNAFTVFVANMTKKEILFHAQDSRLYMKVQALDVDSQWKDIEYLPSSWCGNSYHTLTLEKGQYWEFHTPAYEGDFKTKLRVSLDYIDPRDGSSRTRTKRNFTIYSNEYEAGINPAQFWRKREYESRGIMDPYND